MRLGGGGEGVTRKPSLASGNKTLFDFFKITGGRQAERLSLVAFFFPQSLRQGIKVIARGCSRLWG